VIHINAVVKVLVTAVHFAINITIVIYREITKISRLSVLN